MEERPNISLCMIVRNEETFIEQCLNSVQNLVDEIIIVDTGSTDTTLEKCESFESIKIYHYQWNNHFADARNYGLAKANGDWILCLDADEEMDLLNQGTVKDMMLRTKADIIQLPVLNYFGEKLPVNRNHVFTYYQPRLFRNHAGIQFKNRVHETLYYPKTINATETEQIPISIHHYGYISEIEINKNKGQRNMQLLEMELEKIEEDPWIGYYLASEHYRNQNYTYAFEYINQSIVHFLLQNIKPPSILYRLKYGILMETNSLAGAWPGIEKAIMLYPDYVDLHYCKGYLLYQKGDYAHALHAFEKCLELGQENDQHLILKGTGSYRALEWKEKCIQQLDNQVKFSNTKDKKKQSDPK